MQALMRFFAGYCAIALVGFMSFGQNLLFLSSAFEPETSSDNHEQSIIANSDQGSIHDLFRILTLTEPGSEDSDEQKDDRSEEDIELSPSSALNYQSNWRAVVSFLESVRVRQPVSLYVLHHSWRSFLS